MTTTTTALIPWSPPEAIALPASAQPKDIVTCAHQLNERDRNAIVVAFQSKAYEMAATFVWMRALTSLKKQLAGLGMEFVGEMLQRSDLTEASNPITEIREDEAIELAEQVGMIGTTEAIRLRNHQTLITHFSDPAVSQKEQMHLEEAVSILRSCVVNFLAAPSINPPLPPFLELRNKLQSEKLQEDSPEIQAISNAPYFFLRTTLTLLLAQLKTAGGARLEHVAGNVAILLPAMWKNLRENDRWQTGETYAIVHSANRKIAASGLREALTKVKGFDFVPETLRSDTFRLAARAVIGAHVAYDNFYNEPKPMQSLALLGSSIPGPAMADCFSAALCVRLGNQYGVSDAAQPFADHFLRLFRPNQWEYYLQHLLKGDRHILDKLSFGGSPLGRWQNLVSDFNFERLIPSLGFSIQRIISSDPSKKLQIQNVAKQLRERIMQEA